LFIYSFAFKSNLNDFSQLKATQEELVAFCFQFCVKSIQIEVIQFNRNRKGESLRINRKMLNLSN